MKSFIEILTEAKLNKTESMLLKKLNDGKTDKLGRVILMNKREVNAGRTLSDKGLVNFINSSEFAEVKKGRRNYVYYTKVMDYGGSISKK